MQRTLVLNVVGLTKALLGPHTPRLQAFAEAGGALPLRTICPALTCSVQSTFVTGALPSQHGCVANGWYFRDLAQVWLWRQSNALVEGPKLWELGRDRDRDFTCAKLFWWYNMYASVDWAVTPRPIYRADGRKLPDIHTAPGSLRAELTRSLGSFPLFNFWGPRADISSSRWIARAAIELERRHQPSLNLVYLPHLDYDLQRFGPDGPEAAAALREIDAVCGELLDAAEAAGLRVVILSEYGITAVDGPVHINRALRAAGLVATRTEIGEEHFDAGASRAFAVADHQVAHVYVRDPEDVAKVRALLEGLDGVERVLDASTKAAAGLDHPRSGELVAISKAKRWFSYYWWLDDARAPDYARTVDIHRKPGYDPAELFVDPQLRAPQLRVASWLLRSKLLNQRALLDLIPLDASIVRGSHGRVTDSLDAGPVFLTNAPELLPQAEAVEATAVQGLLLDHVFGRQARASERRRDAS
ncbi:type I phosphodiesterase/nucleotide pyrophosphatase [Plesiocystis pacifica SIR-1]|uniref:Type I phosphodiesterase/nucleotide pyrophosphatase n=1 Tax=Plesiocystis pacifica SIR-1 TaxID=391625 RepID=A6G3W2_9BACT|nr:nucleotide pyrophosphatase/phosphodiesterase family protein [Plesiocystis pacifica]EDM79499.1 type I phosphodiesterase/nucleotide pyrophosphatase [Plesiocystis pacifica SIR-1]